LTRDSRILTNSQKKKSKTPAELVQRLTRDSRTLTVAQILKSQCLSAFTIESQCVEDFFFLRMSATDNRTHTEAIILKKKL